MHNFKFKNNMTTYSKKYFNKETGKWEPLYSTEGRSAYETAKLNGYTGTEEEFNKVLSQIPGIIASIENYPTEGSKNLITSGGVYQAVKDSETSAEETHQELLNEISNVNSTLSTEISTVNTNLTTKITQIETTTIPNAIKAAIVDNLDTEDSNKALSATQGKILKTMISNLANLRIEVVNELPSTGETNVIYLVKKAGTNPDVHDEYVYVEGNWEKIGNTEVDLSNYYTKDQVYSKSEVDEKIGSAGDVMASGDLVTDYIIVGAGTKSIKNSGQTLSNLALKNEIPSLEGYATQSWVTNQGYLTSVPAQTWASITGKPSTFTPSAHTQSYTTLTGSTTTANQAIVSNGTANG